MILILSNIEACEFMNDKDPVLPSLKPPKNYSQLFEWLAVNPPLWWKNLTADPELYVDIRRREGLNVYYRGASIMDLGYDNRQGPFAKINIKYVPLTCGNDYLNYKIDLKNEAISFSEARQIELDNFNLSVITAIKERINLIYGTGSEKTLQGKYVCTNNMSNSTYGYFIDTEFSFEDSRVDMVWVDYKSTSIVFIELKTIGDPRLYGDGSGTSIKEQLKRYSAIASKKSPDLLQYFSKVHEIKKRLNLLPLSAKPLSLEKYHIEKRPILLIGNCSDEWIKNNATVIDEKVKEYAYGTVCQGIRTFSFRGLNARSSKYYRWYPLTNG
jgi:hypothetical protein